MKAIYFFYLGAGVDIFALLVAFYFIITDMLNGHNDTHNPTMFTAVFVLMALVGGAFWLKSIGKIILANILLWVPGFPLFCYGLVILLIVIGKPDMR